MCPCVWQVVPVCDMSCQACVQTVIGDEAAVTAYVEHEYGTLHVNCTNERFEASASASSVQRSSCTCATHGKINQPDLVALLPTGVPDRELGRGVHGAGHQRGSPQVCTRPGQDPPQAPVQGGSRTAFTPGPHPPPPSLVLTMC